MRTFWIWGLIGALCLGLVVIAGAQGASPAPAAPTVPPIVAPVAPKPAEAASSGVNLLQWITLGAALLGAFIKRLNDASAETKSWRTVFDVAVTGGATYVMMDMASELGFLQEYMAVMAKKPLTLGVVSFLASILAGAGVVAAVQALFDNSTALLKKISGKSA